MTDDWQHSEPPDTDRSLLERVDRACDRFEFAWRNGECPTIEGYLEDVPEPDRPATFRELLATEIELRRSAGERPGLDEYRPRFLGRFGTIEPLFETTTGPGSSRIEGPGIRSRTPCREASSTGGHSSGDETLAMLGDLLGGLRGQDAAAPSAGAPPEVPGYEILEELGRGGMGVVYLAREIRLKRLCALKMILSGRFARPEDLARFLVEAETAAQLRHPNIVQIYRLGDHEGRPFLVFEYVEGGSLARGLDGTPRPPREAAELIAILSRAMAEAHRSGIVHRDLKPSNILLAPDGTPKIGDFGLVRRLDDESSLTPADGILGTPSYMSPEQAGGRASQAGKPADVYALGAILYEVLTGRPPFRGASVLETLEQVRSADPVPPGRLQPRIPRDLDTICSKCLEKDPSRRYRDAAALADELDRFLTYKPISARPIGPAARLVRWRRRNPTQAVAAALGIVALVAAVGASGAFGLYQTRVAGELRSALRRSRLLSADLTLERGIILCERGDLERGLVAMARSLELAAEADDATMVRVLRAELARWSPSLHPRLAQLEHDDRVTAVAFSPDGRSVLTGSRDRTARLRDAHTGALLCEPLRHDEPVLGVAFVLGGLALVTVEEDGPARVWDLRGGSPRFLPLPHPGGARSAVTSPDGRLVLTIGDDGSARLWDAATATSVGAPFTHKGPVLAAAFRPDGRSVATGGEDGFLRVWSLNGGGNLASIAHPSPVVAVAFSPDGRTLVVGCEGGSAHLWDPSSGRPIAEPWRHEAPVSTVSVSPDGSTAMTAGRDWVAQLRDIRTGKPRIRPLRHRDPIMSAIFSGDGRSILTGGLDGVARLWDARTGVQIGSTMSHRGEIHAMAFAPDGRSAATAGISPTAWVWSLTAEVPREPTPPGDASIYAIDISPDRSVAAAGGEDGRVRLWDLAAGRPIGEATRHDDAVRALAFSPDGAVLASAGEDGAIRLWDLRAGGPIGGPWTHPAKVTGLAFSRDGRLLLSGLRDGTVSLWDVAAGRRRASFRAHRGAVWSLAFSPDGTTALSGSADHTARFWATAPLAPLGAPLSHPGGVLAVAYAPDGQTVATSSSDAAVWLWNAPDGTPAGSQLIGAVASRTLAFGPDGRTLFAGGRNASSQAWDLASRKPLGPAIFHEGPVLAIRIGPEDRSILIAAEDGVRRIELPSPLDGPVQQVVLEVELATAMAPTGDGGVRALSADEWARLRRVKSRTRIP